MKITILVNYDLASALALNFLLPKLQEHDVSVFYTNKTFHRHAFPLALAELIAYEKDLLESRVAGFKTFSELPPYTEQFARLDEVNRGTGLQQLRSSKPDLILSIRHMTVLQQVVIDLPPHGVINLHSGLLPEYQGVMASFWAMLNREHTLGTTLHRIEDSSIDSGAIIARATCSAQYHKSYLWNVLNLYHDGCELMLAAVAKLATGVALQQSAQQGYANYYSFPKDADIFQFFQQGNTLFDKSERQKLMI